MKAKKITIEIIKNLLIILTSITMVVPLLLIIVNSFKTRYEADTMSLSLPAVFHFDNYLTVITEGKLINSFFNSFLYSACSVAISVVLASMASFVISRNKTKLNNFIYYYILMGLVIPTNYITLTKVMQFTHLINTQVGVIILDAAGQVPFSMFLIFGFIATIPRELDEAATIDGCLPLRLFFKIIFPLLKPVVVTLVVLNFMGVWNDFVNPLYFLNSQTLWPMTLAVYNFFGRFSQQWNLVCADILLTTITVIAVYVFGQKYIVSGMTTGSVKG